jgi:hypothetical protein
MTDADQSLDLDALLDPVRLAAAWQIARERPAVASEAHEDDEVSEGDDADAFAAEATDAGAPARAAPLPVALAHQQLLDEIEHTLAAVPAIAAKARSVLAVPLAQLAKAIDPIELAAAEVALDQLEDLWQALLSDAGWPKIPDRGEDW